MTRWYNNKWVLLFMLVPFFKPVCFQYFSVLLIMDGVFIIWKIAAACLAVAVLISQVYNQLRIPRLIVLVILFELVIVISTFYHYGYFQRAVIDAVSVAAFTSLIILGIKNNCNGTLFLLGRILSALMLINLISMILFPGGLPADLYYNNAENPLFFMTIDNGSGLFLIFCIMVFSTEFYVMQDRSKLILCFCCMISAVLSRSGTTILSVELQVMLLILLFWKISFQNIPWKTLYLAYSAASAVIILVPQNEFIRGILTEVLHYSSDLSGRALLWSVATGKIRNSFWMGYGRSADSYILAWGGVYTSHNFWLEVMLQGGFIALVILILCIFACLHRQERQKQGKLVKSIGISFFAMLVSCMMESTVHSVYIFGTMVFLYYSRYFYLASEENISGTV